MGQTYLRFESSRRIGPGKTLYRSCLHSLQIRPPTFWSDRLETHMGETLSACKGSSWLDGLELRDPNMLPPCSDGSPAHPHLVVQRGVTCLQCRYRITSPNLLRRHMAEEHDQRKCRNESDKGTVWAEANVQSWSQNGKREFWIVRTKLGKKMDLRLWNNIRGGKEDYHRYAKRG